MLNWREGKNRIFTKVISFLMAQVFFLTSVGYPAPSNRSLFRNKRPNYQAIQEQRESALQKRKNVLSGNTQAKKSPYKKDLIHRIKLSFLKDLSSIYIPDKLGRVVEVYQGEKSSPLIVHIQDLHTNPEAQFNEANILELLIKDYGMNLVCSEGADGEVDTSSVSSFPDAEVREKTARLFVNSGELTAEEYLSITKYPDLPIWGIEDKDIYFKNIIEFNKIMRFSDNAQIFIGQVKEALQKLKPKIYSKELLEIDAKGTEYEGNKIETNKYIDYLLALYSRLNLGQRLVLTKYKNISLLHQTIQLEKNIDQQKIIQESQSLLIDLQSTLSQKNNKNEIDTLLAKASLFKDQKIAPFSFYSYLDDLARRYLRDKLDNYLNLEQFVEYLKKLNALDSIKLFQEIEQLTYEVKDFLSTNENQKLLTKSFRHIKFLGDFFNLKVSNEQLDYYLANREDFKVAFFKGFLEENLHKYHIVSPIDYNQDLIDENFPELEHFYDIAYKRDKAMVNNAINEIEKRNVRCAAIIAGGFHTRGITQRLKEEGYSYTVISPYSSTDIDEENYQFLLSGKRKPLSELIEGLSDQLRVPLANSKEEKAEFSKRFIESGRSDGGPIKPRAFSTREDLFGDTESIKGKDVVVVGCGAGIEAFAPKISGANSVIGVDKDPNVIKLANIIGQYAGYSDVKKELSSRMPYIDIDNLERLIAKGSPHRPLDNVDFLVSDAREMILGDNSCDLLVFNWVLGIYRGIDSDRDIERAFKEAIRVTRPGGEIRIVPKRMSQRDSESNIIDKLCQISTSGKVVKLNMIREDFVSFTVQKETRRHASRIKVKKFLDEEEGFLRIRRDIYNQWRKDISKAKGEGKFEALKKLLESRYNIEVIDEEWEGISDDFAELVAFLLSFVPEGVLDKNINIFSFGGGMDPLMAEDIGFYDTIEKKVEVSNEGINYWDLYTVARNFLHELGHAAEETFSKGELRTIRTAFAVLKREMKKGYTRYSLLLDSDRNNILDDRVKSGIVEYLERYEEPSQFIAEFFRQFILNGDELRALIENQSDPDVKRALKSVYEIYRKKFGREIKKKDLKRLRGIFGKLKISAMERIEDEFKTATKYKIFEGVFEQKFGVTIEDYRKLKSLAKTQNLSKPTYEMIHNQIMASITEMDSFDKGLPSPSLIGKWLDREGGVIKRNVEVELNRNKTRTTFTYKGDGTKKTIDILEIIEDKARIQSLIDRCPVIVNLKDKDKKNAEEIIRQFSFDTIKYVVKLKDDENIRGFRDGDTLYLSEFFFNLDGTINIIALFHELGEGSSLILPEGVNKHTYLRGCGKDVRDVVYDLVRENRINETTTDAEDIVREIGQRLKGLGIEKPGQKVRTLAESEMSLVLYNYSLGLRGLELVYGLQSKVFGKEDTLFTLSLIHHKENVIKSRESIVTTEKYKGSARGKARGGREKVPLRFYSDKDLTEDMRDSLIRALSDWPNYAKGKHVADYILGEIRSEEPVFHLFNQIFVFNENNEFIGIFRCFYTEKSKKIKFQRQVNLLSFIFNPAMRKVGIEYPDLEKDLFVRTLEEASNSDAALAIYFIKRLGKDNLLDILDRYNVSYDFVRERRSDEIAISPDGVKKLYNGIIGEGKRSKLGKIGGKFGEEEGFIRIPGNKERQRKLQKKSIIKRFKWMVIVGAIIAVSYPILLKILDAPEEAKRAFKAINRKGAVYKSTQEQFRQELRVFQGLKLNTLDRCTKQENRKIESFLQPPGRLDAIMFSAKVWGLEPEFLAAFGYEENLYKESRNRLEEAPKEIISGLRSMVGTERSTQGLYQVNIDAFIHDREFLETLYQNRGFFRKGLEAKRFKKTDRENLEYFIGQWETFRQMEGEIYKGYTGRETRFWQAVSGLADIELVNIFVGGYTIRKFADYIANSKSLNKDKSIPPVSNMIDHSSGELANSSAWEVGLYKKIPEQWKKRYGYFLNTDYYPPYIYHYFVARRYTGITSDDPKKEECWRAVAKVNSYLMFLRSGVFKTYKKSMDRQKEIRQRFQRERQKQPPSREKIDKKSLKLAAKSKNKPRGNWTTRLKRTAAVGAVAAGVLLGSASKSTTQAQTTVAPEKISLPGIAQTQKQPVLEVQETSKPMESLRRYKIGGGFYYMPLDDQEFIKLKNGRIFDGQMVDPEGNVIRIVKEGKLIMLKVQEGKDIFELTPLPEFDEVVITKYIPAGINFDKVTDFSLLNNLVLHANVKKGDVKYGEKLGGIIHTNKEVANITLSSEEKDRIINTFVDSLGNIIANPSYYFTEKASEYKRLQTFILNEISKLIDDIANGRKKIIILSRRDLLIGKVDERAAANYRPETGEIVLNCIYRKPDMNKILYTLIHEIIGHDYFCKTLTRNKLLGNLTPIDLLFNEIFAFRTQFMFSHFISEKNSEFYRDIIITNPKNPKSFRISGVCFDKNLDIALPELLLKPEFLMLYVLEIGYNENLIQAYLRMHPEVRYEKRHDIFMKVLKEIKNRIETILDNKEKTELISKEAFIYRESIANMIKYLESAISYYEKVRPFYDSHGIFNKEYRNDFTDEVDGISYKRGTIIRRLRGVVGPCTRFLLNGTVILPDGRQIKHKGGGIGINIDNIISTSGTIQYRGAFEDYAGKKYSILSFGRNQFDHERNLSFYLKGDMTIDTERLGLSRIFSNAKDVNFFETIYDNDKKINRSRLIKMLQDPTKSQYFQLVKVGTQLKVAMMSGGMREEDAQAERLPYNRRLEPEYKVGKNLNFYDIREMYMVFKKVRNQIIRNLRNSDNNVNKLKVEKLNRILLFSIVDLLRKSNLGSGEASYDLFYNGFEIVFRDYRKSVDVDSVISRIISSAKLKGIMQGDFITSFTVISNGKGMGWKQEELFFLRDIEAARIKEGTEIRLLLYLPEKKHGLIGKGKIRSFLKDTSRYDVQHMKKPGKAYSTVAAKKGRIEALLEKEANIDILYKKIVAWENEESGYVGALIDLVKEKKDRDLYMLLDKFVVEEGRLNIPVLWTLFKTIGGDYYNLACAEFEKLAEFDRGPQAANRLMYINSGTTRRLSEFYGVIKTYIGDLRTKEILDIGCSYGLLLYVLRELGIEAVGLESDNVSANFGNFRGGLKIKEGDITKDLPQDLLRHFDVTLSVYAFYNKTKEDFSKAVNNISKLTKDGGLSFHFVPVNWCSDFKEALKDTELYIVDEIKLREDVVLVLQKRTTFFNKKDIIHPKAIRFIEPFHTLGRGTRSGA